MTELSLHGIRIDACRGGCGGLWLDNWELQKIDEPDEEADRVLAEMDVDLSVDVDLDRKLSCPRCADTILMRHPYKAHRNIIIDECPACAGIWLDFGELYEIRKANEQDAHPRPRMEAGNVIRALAKLRHPDA